MGCDIHCTAEVRQHDGSWQAVTTPLFPCEYEESGLTTEPFYWRDYRMFTLFAGVRNYREGVPVIAEPRGWPTDVSPQAQEDSDRYGVDGHSHSWLTVAELQAVDYDQALTDGRYADRPLREMLDAEYFPCLGILASLGAPEDIRIVFFFDN